jgi:outer membrane receptor protein involved in Fe transport
MEGKKAFLKYFEFRANVTLVKSQTTLYLTTTKPEIRPLFGQAPYVVNGLLAYTSGKGGITAALSYNLQGPRLVLATRSQNTPDIYELPMHLMDFKISKSLGEHFSLGLKVRNILNSTYRKSYDFNDFKDYYEHRNYGTDFNISVSYHN